MADHLLVLLLRHLRYRADTFAGKVKIALSLVMLFGVLATGGVLAARRLAPEPPLSAERAPPTPAPLDGTGTPPSPPSRLVAEGVIRLPQRGDVTSVAFAPDGKTLSTANMQGDLDLWDVASGKAVWRAESVKAFSVAFSPDGRTLAAGGYEGTVQIWDAAKGTKIREFRADFEEIYTLAFAPDGKVLALGGRSHLVSVCDVVSGKAVRHLKGQGRIHAVAFSPDGTMLACGTTGDRVQVWDIASGEEARPFRGKEIRGGCVAFSPDGRILATGQTLAAGNRDTICCREVATGEVVRRISMSGQPLRTEEAHALAFAPDGRALAAGGGAVVKVWGLATGQLLGKFEGHCNAIFSLDFALDGKCLAAGGRNKTANLWDVPRRMKKEEVSLPAFSAEALESLWQSLAEKDAPTAYRAVWTLSAAPEQAVPLLRERLRSATAFDARRVKQLIADLDSDTFVVRQQAETDLAKLGWVVESTLRRAQQDGLSLEMRRRLTNLVQEIEKGNPSAEWLRMARAIAVLEQIGTPEARRILQALADGAPEARLTRETKEALRRLAKQATALRARRHE